MLEILFNKNKINSPLKVIRYINNYLKKDSSNEIIHDAIIEDLLIEPMPQYLLEKIERENKESEPGKILIVDSNEINLNFEKYTVGDLKKIILAQIGSPFIIKFNHKIDYATEDVNDIKLI